MLDELNIPKAYNWESLTALKGAELELHYATPIHFVAIPHRSGAAVWPFEK